MKNITTRTLITIALTGWGILFLGAFFTLQNWSFAQVALYVGLGMIVLSTVLALVSLLMNRGK